MSGGSSNECVDGQPSMDWDTVKPEDKTLVYQVDSPHAAALCMHQQTPSNVFRSHVLIHAQVNSLLRFWDPDADAVSCARCVACLYRQYVLPVMAAHCNIATR